MNTRLFSRSSPRSPRRRLALFSGKNEKPKTEIDPCPRLDMDILERAPDLKPPSASSFSSSSLSTLKKPTQLEISPKKTKPPTSPSKTRAAVPRSSPPKRNTGPTAASMLASRLPPPPLTETSSDVRPGVSFQRNQKNNALSSKVSTYDATRRVTFAPDPVTAKIEYFEENRHRRPSLSANAPWPMPSSGLSQDPLVSPKREVQGRSSYVPPPCLTDSPPTHRVEPSVTYMEIAPGQRLRLRGARETWQCVENDYYLPTTCFSCDTDLCCIMDASYVLCPLCKVVSPVEGWAGGPEGGVGLGFTYTDLAQWQQEIMQRRRQQVSGTLGY